MKTWSVVFDPDALNDLDNIEVLISDRDTPGAAARYIERIIAFCEGLEYAPERGEARNDIRPGFRILGFERRVSIAIWLRDDEVHIVRVFYAGQRVVLTSD